MELLSIPKSLQRIQKKSTTVRFWIFHNPIGDTLYNLTLDYFTYYKQHIIHIQILQ